MKKLAFVFLIRLTELTSVQAASGTGKDPNGPSQQSSSVLKAGPQDGTAHWTRYLHQKNTSTELFIFGGNAKIDIGETTLTSSGAFMFKNGVMKHAHGNPLSGTLNFSYTNFKINSDRSSNDEELLVPEEYPELTIHMKNFKRTESGYIIETNITVKGVTKPYTLHGSVVKHPERTLTLKSHFTIQTLDFPIREKAHESTVLKDEIEVDLEVDFR